VPALIPAHHFSDRLAFLDQPYPGGIVIGIVADRRLEARARLNADIYLIRVNCCLIFLFFNP
jgi:hypothetical protein